MANLTFTNAGGDWDWFNTGNWLEGAVPTADDAVTVGTTEVGTVILGDNAEMLSLTAPGFALGIDTNGSQFTVHGDYLNGDGPLSGNGAFIVNPVTTATINVNVTGPLEIDLYGNVTVVNSAFAAGVASVVIEAGSNVTWSVPTAVLGTLGLGGAGILSVAPGSIITADHLDSAGDMTSTGAWHLVINTSYVVHGGTITWCDATGSFQAIDVSSVLAELDGGNNVNWVFAAPAPTLYVLTMSQAFDLTGASPYEAGDAVTVRAADPDNGSFRFDHWECDVGDANALFADVNAVQTTFTMPASDVTAHAVFIVWHALTVVGGDLPDVGDATSDNVFRDTVVNIEAVPPSLGVVFDHWESNFGGVFGDNNASSTTFTMPDTDTTVTAWYTNLPAPVSGGFFFGF